MVEHDIKTETILKCWHCKGEIVLETTELIVYRDKPFHRKCLLEKETAKKRGALKLEDIPEFLEKIKPYSESYAKQLIDRNVLIKWIQAEYNTIVLPSFVINKLDKIINGTMDGLTIPIPPDHMLDMWIRKISELRKIEQYNLKQGKKFKKPHLISYDMSIVASKYPSYLKHMEEKILAKEAGVFAPNRKVVLVEMEIMMNTKRVVMNVPDHVKEHEDMLNDFINDIMNTDEEDN